MKNISVYSLFIGLLITLLSFLLVARPDAAQLSFSEANYPIKPEVAYEIITSDLNGDGYLDLVVGQSLHCLSRPTSDTRAHPGSAYGILPAAIYAKQNGFAPAPILTGDQYGVTDTYTYSYK